VPPEAIRRRILAVVTAALIAGFFLFFTWRSIFFYFDKDDMMNLYLAWHVPVGQILEANLIFWSDFIRPMGQLFYRAIFAFAGFNPVPFRIACLALCALNLGLCFWFARLISGSDRVAALAALLFAFHVRLIEVWYRTAVIYDVLCFTFFYTGLCLYISARKNGRHPGVARLAAILLCFVCALNSKEMAVALPVAIAGYELIFSEIQRERPRPRNFVFAIALGLMNIPFILGKTSGPNAMTVNPAYRSEYSFARFTHSWALYLNYLVLSDDWIQPLAAAGLLALLLLIGLALRSRELTFAWLILFSTTLPVIFLPYRGGFVMYISYAGWTLYAAVLLVLLQNALTHTYPQYRTALACVVFVLVGWRWGKANLHDLRIDPKSWLYDPAAQVHAFAGQMRALHWALPRGAATLFVEDPFTTGEWTPYFVMKLLYRDDSLTVDRIKMMNPKPSGWSGYQYVFTFEGGKYRQLKP
jgi:hypothetical protein